MNQMLFCTLNQLTMKKYLSKIVSLDKSCVKSDAYFAVLPWGITNYMLDLDNKWNLSQIAVTEKDEVAGVLICSKYNDKYCHIHRVLTSSDWRRHQVATKLQKRLEACGISDNLCYITLFVHAENRAAIIAYEKWGYKRCTGIEFVNIAEMKSRSIESDSLFFDEYNMPNYIYKKVLDLNTIEERL